MSDPTTNTDAGSASARSELVYRSLGRTPFDAVELADGLRLGRVSIVHGVSAEVVWADDDGREVTATCHFASGLDLRPVAGDWVGLRDQQVVAVLPRRSALRRPDPHKHEVQILAANLDLVLLVIPIDRGLNIRMLERFAVMAWDSGARPFIILTKADEATDISALESTVSRIVPDVEVLTTSSHSGEGIGHLRELLREGVTAVMLGASGAGKTSLLNALEGTAEVTRTVSRGGEGRHATTTRRLYRLSGGGVLLDIPGIRLLDIMVGQEGVNETFSDIADIAELCRFRDCAHHGDEGCAVEAAVASGTLAVERLENWRLITSELAKQERQRTPNADAAQKRRKRAASRTPRTRPDPDDD